MRNIDTCAADRNQPRTIRVEAGAMAAAIVDSCVQIPANNDVSHAGEVVMNQVPYGGDEEPIGRFVRPPISEFMRDIPA